MDPAIREHLPIFLGAVVVAMTGVGAVLSGYKWLIREIRDAVGDKLDAHEGREEEWQKAIEHRLDQIEQKVDELVARNGRHGG